MVRVRVDGELRAAECGGRVTGGSGAGSRHRRHREFSGHSGLHRIAHRGDGIGPIAHEGRVPVLKREPRLLFVPGQYVEWSDVRLVKLVSHELERSHGFGAIHDDLASVVDYPTAE